MLEPVQAAKNCGSVAALSAAAFKMQPFSTATYCVSWRHRLRVLNGALFVATSCARGVNVLVLTLPVSNGGAHDAARLPGVDDDAVGGSNLFRPTSVFLSDNRFIDRQL